MKEHIEKTVRTIPCEVQVSILKCKYISEHPNYGLKYGDEYVITIIQKEPSIVINVRVMEKKDNAKHVVKLKYEKIGCLLQDWQVIEVMEGKQWKKQ